MDSFSGVNAKRIGSIEECFGSLGKPLSSPGRTLLAEGTLLMKSEEGMDAKEFFLFNDILVYGTILTPKKKYCKQVIIPLREMCLVSHQDEKSWLIKTNGLEFTVISSTAGEKREWITRIQKCLRAIPDAPLPEWVPDSESDECMRCNKVKFSLLQRRHHCRNCGLLVCSSCSAHRIVLPRLSSKSVRVCFVCYDLFKEVLLGDSLQSGEEYSMNLLDTDISQHDLPKHLSQFF